MRKRRPLRSLTWSLLFLLGCEPGPGPSTDHRQAALARGAGPVAADRELAGGAHRPIVPLLGPDILPDVPAATIARLRRSSDVAGMAALYDELSWQNFVAINWPTDDRGHPRPRLGDPGAPAWVAWRESFEVFAEDGAAPDPWGTPHRSLRALPRRLLGPAGLTSAAVLPTARHERVLFPPTVRGRSPHAEGLNQPFSLPLWDQAGNLVYYEVLINRSEFDYLVAHQLYNLDGQVAFASAHPGRDLDPGSCNHPNRSIVDFPAGQPDGGEVGAIEIKLAWRQLTPSDSESRYLAVTGWVPKNTRIEGGCATGDLRVVADGGEWKPVRLGLVGFHIGHKTASAPQWVWSTFEHIDNLAASRHEAEHLARHGKTLRPSFFDPTCPGCPVNTCAAPPQKNQLRRILPIDRRTTQLNARMQHLLSAQGSPLAYYELVGSQFPTQPEALPTRPQAEPGCSGPTATPINLPGSVHNKSGGHPHPVFLTNLTLESFFQRGVQPACLQVEPGICPDPLPPSAPTIDATESCIGCHSSAPIASGGTPKPGTQEATYSTQLSGDYSWLLSARAFWKK